MFLPQSLIELITTRQKSTQNDEVIKHDIYPFDGTLKNLRMPACCYQLKLARKAETFGKRHFSSQISFFSPFFW